MVKVVNIETREPENIGCNNGNYGFAIITATDGEKEWTVRDYYCRCGKGCSNTMRMPHVNDEFLSREEFGDFLDDAEYVIEAENSSWGFIEVCDTRREAESLVNEWLSEEGDDNVYEIYRDTEKGRRREFIGRYKK